MIIYIDSDYLCHTSNPDGKYQKADTDLFDGKCKTFIESYRFVPFGKSWEREDGAVFQGEMIAPAVDYSTISIAQEQYDLNMAEAAMSYQEGVDSA